MSLPGPSLTTCALLCALSVGFATHARAHKRFAKKEGVECKECHVNPEGSGPRNLIGKYYQAKQELPIARDEQTMKLVTDTVDRWMLEVLQRPPVITWSHKPLAKLPMEPARAYAPASNTAIARRMSLDLRGTSPTPDETLKIASGKMTLEEYADDLLASKDFQTTFTLYHRDLIRPRTGDINTDASYSLVQEVFVDGEKVFTSSRLRAEASSGKCRRDQRVQVSPWWDRTGSHWACADTASTALTANVNGTSLRCDSVDGQASGQCGCGPYMLFCYPQGIKETVIKSMKDEGARIAMTVINEDLPYSTLLTSDWTVLDGALEVFYAKLDGSLPTLADPDIKKPPRKVMRPERHSGILSTPEMLNFFYNGRRWAQRTFEAFFCHEVFPDFDLLDDTRDAGIPAVPYRDTPHLDPSLTVTESRACAACHLQLDGLSRVKDRWDPFGRYYEKTDRGIPIPQSAMFEGQLVDGLDGFGKALGASPVFHDCVTNQVWEHMTGHRFRPDERATREQLVARFQASNLNFKELVRAIVKTPEYRSTANVKLMTKELYTRAMGRATDVAWKTGDKGDKVGWEIYYDKVGGMDYRKIEMRDIRPGIGHSLVQMKGASETCAELVNRDMKKDGKRMLITNDDPAAMPTADELESTLKRLYLRAYARPWDDVPEAERELMRDLFKSTAKGSVADGYRAICTATFASSDFAVF